MEIIEGTERIRQEIDRYKTERADAAARTKKWKFTKTFQQAINHYKTRFPQASIAIDYCKTMFPQANIKAGIISVFPYGVDDRRAYATHTFSTTKKAMAFLNEALPITPCWVRYRDLEKDVKCACHSCTQRYGRGRVVIGEYQENPNEA